MRFIAFITGLVLITSGVHSQSPYSISTGRESIIAAGSVALYATHILLQDNLEPFTINTLNSLDPKDVNALDRRVIGLYSLSADKRSDLGKLAPVILSGAAVIALPGVHSENGSFIEELSVLAIIWTEANLLNASATSFLKTVTARTRPIAYNTALSTETRLNPDLDIRESFVSGHTSLSAVNSFFTAKVFADYFPGSRWKPLVWGLAAIIPAWTGFERIRAGLHFPTDVIGGYALGAMCGYFIPSIHKKPEDEKLLNYRISPVSSFHHTGLKFSMRF
ncbi:MAG: phosphatase PAP2 family protein [Bacteroidales bacterium]|nr:phosphatase PAP2 family protein [Bacteroidales bacterium]